MRLLILGIAVATVVFSQNKGTTTQQAKDCAQNFVGNNNTGIVTCYNVDKKLAGQIGQLVAASKRDGKTLKDISDKVEALLKELHNQTPGTSVISINQQGGITAGQVNITGPNAVKVSFTEISSNQQEGTDYVSRIRVNLSGQVPEFAIAASAPSLVNLSFGPEGGGVMQMVREGTTQDGARFHSSRILYGSYLLTLRSSIPERFRLQYECGGVTCVRP